MFLIHYNFLTVGFFLQIVKVSNENLLSLQSNYTVKQASKFNLFLKKISLTVRNNILNFVLMTPISEANFIVVDVETTGSSPMRNRITDIACITVKNFEIINTYSSLVNPHQRIPWYIQKITGITNSMVVNAPESNTIFQDIQKILVPKNTFFVAHNSPFDWNFVYETFKRESIFINELSTICTFKIARKIIPPNVRKNVGSLADFFQIPMQNHHRAYDDAFATANFFIEMLYILQDRYEISTVEEIIEFQNKKQRNTAKIDIKVKNKLLQYKKISPDQYGILMFIGANGKVLYISKTNDISQQINSFAEQTEISSKKMNRILKKFMRLEWIETNNELETYILENRKIKFFEPEYNVRQNIDLVNADDIKINTLTHKKLVKNLSMIVLLPNSEREKTIDVYYINSGKFIKTLTVGSRANLGVIFDEVHNAFYSEAEDYDEIDLDEIRIINNWLRKYDGIAKIFLHQEQDELLFAEEIENAIRNFYNELADNDIDGC